MAPRAVGAGGGRGVGHGADGRIDYFSGFGLFL